MTKKKTEKTEAYTVSFLLDETGSMMPKKEETIISFNNYVDSIKKEKNSAKTKFTLAKFNTMNIEKPYERVNLKDVKPLTKENYKPDNCTNLYDAIGKIVSETKAEKNEKVLFVILTDGEENSSKEYDKKGIKILIEEKQKEGWQFVFLGVGIDAYAEAIKMGIQLAGRSGSRAGGMSAASMATKCFMSNGDVSKLDLNTK